MSIHNASIDNIFVLVDVDEEAVLMLTRCHHTSVASDVFILIIIIDRSSSNCGHGSLYLDGKVGFIRGTGIPTDVCNWGFQYHLQCSIHGQ